MIRKGSLVKLEGKNRFIATGRHLFVHDVKEDKAIVWDNGPKGFIKRTVPLKDLTSISDPPDLD